MNLGVFETSCCSTYRKRCSPSRSCFNTTTGLSWAGNASVAAMAWIRLDLDWSYTCWWERCNIDIALSTPADRLLWQDVISHGAVQAGTRRAVTNKGPQTKQLELWFLLGPGDRWDILRGRGGTKLLAMTRGSFSNRCATMFSWVTPRSHPSYVWSPTTLSSNVGGLGQDI